MEYIDLTHTFDKDTPAYPGDPKPQLIQTATIAHDGYTDHHLSTLMHVGTHMDAPLHMIEGGATIDGLSVEQLFCPGVLLDARGKPAVDASLLDGIPVPPGACILVYTGHEDRWKTDGYFDGHPRITEDFARKTVDLQAHIVGMDMLGPDADPFPIHKILLSSGVLIIENMDNLGKLLGKSFDVVALPAKFATDGAPVRVVAVLR